MRARLALSGALKLARRYGHDHYGKAKDKIVSFRQSFHGRTWFMVSVGGQPKYTEGFGPIPGGIVHAEFNNLDSVRALIVPGSWLVKQQAEKEGLDKIFTEAGMEWRDAGCSMCLAMNPDRLAPGERSASTSNRNFEGRQGPGGRTHLVSPAMAAAAAIAGHFVDIRTWS